MYEIDVIKFAVEREKVEQTFTIEDYNFENERFMNDYIDFLSVEVVTKVSIVIYHNKDVKHLQIDLKNYLVKRD